MRDLVTPNKEGGNIFVPSVHPSVCLAIRNRPLKENSKSFTQNVM